MILISVVMSTFNTPEEYLRASIESILNQTFKDFEFIIIDDGSTKNDVAIVTSYNDKRIHLIENKENKGLPFSLNRGISNAKGKYIARMDSDDIAFPSRLEIQYRYMEENKDIAVAGCNAIKIGAKTGSMTSISPRINLNTYLVFKNPIIHPSVIMRREFLLNNSLTYDLNCYRGQDYELWSRAGKVGKITIMPNYLLQYRFHENQLTSESSREIRRKNGIELYKKFLPDYGFELSDNMYEVYYDMVNARPINDLILLEKLYNSLITMSSRSNMINKDDYVKILDYFYSYNLLGNFFVKRYKLSKKYIRMVLHPKRLINFSKIFLSSQVRKISKKIFKAK